MTSEQFQACEKKVLTGTKIFLKIPGDKSDLPCFHDFFFEMSDSDGDYLFDSGNNSESDNDEMYCDELESSDSDCILSESEKNGSNNDEYPFEVIGQDKIVSQMSDSVKEVNGVTTIPEAKVKILLNHFKWDKQKLMERFYADEQDDIFKEIIPIQADSANMLGCEICFDTFKKGKCLPTF